MTDTSYNGWTNYETWNVALWIGNDEGLYSLAREMPSGSTYQDFTDLMREIGEDQPIAIETPDNVAWNDSNLDHAELNEMLAELRGDDDDDDDDDCL